MSRKSRSAASLAASPLAPALVIPAALAHSTVEAMLRFAAGRPIAGAVSAVSLSWTLQTLRTMQMTRLAMISALLILGLAATGAAMMATQEREPAQTRPAAPSKTAAQEREPAKPAVPEKKVEILSVRVIDTKGRGVPGVEIKVVEDDSYTRGRWARISHRCLSYRRRRPGSHHRRPRFQAAHFEARPDDRTIGWASLRSGRLLPSATDDDPVTLTLLPRNHHVEGTIVDIRGKPIHGVQVRAVQFNHDANGFAMDYPRGDEEPSLASAVTDEAGRYRLSLPQDTTVMFAAYHPRFVGPFFFCKPEDQTIRPVTLEDAGGIAGTVVDVGDRPAGRGGAGRCPEHRAHRPHPRRRWG